MRRPLLFSNGYARDTIVKCKWLKEVGRCRARIGLNFLWGCQESRAGSKYYNNYILSKKKKWGENEKPLHASADDFWYTEKQLAAPGKGKNLTWSCIFENTLHGHMRHVYRRAETAIWDIMWMCSNTKEYWKNRIISKYDCLVWWKAVEGPPAVFTISSRFLSAKGENNRFKIISRV